MTPTTPEEGAELVTRLRLSLAKARSNAAEYEGLELAELVDPTIRPDSMLVGALERLGERTISWGTANNLLSLARRSEMLLLSYALRWGEELPEPYSFPLYPGGDS